MTGAGIILVASLLLLLIAIALAAYLFFDNQKKSRLLESPDLLSKEEAKRLVAEVGKTVVLPQGEDPVIITVVDKEKVKDQPFFVKAENGDKVLLYVNSKKAILYRPKLKKIVEIGPIDAGSAIDQSSSTDQGTQSPTSNPDTSNNQPIVQTPAPKVYTVAIYNGSNIAGLAASLEEKIKTKYTNLNIVAKADAANKNYSKTKVIDLNGNGGQIVADLAAFLDAEVVGLPDGESRPDNSEILIVGATL